MFKKIFNKKSDTVPEREPNEIGSSILRVISDPIGIIFGQKDGEAVCAHPSCNSMIFGPSGSGKTRSFTFPNVLARIKRGQSYFVTDPSGDIYRKTAAAAKLNGFDVKIFNTTNLLASDGWDPLASIRNLNEQDRSRAVSEITSVIMNNTSGKSDAFFDQSEEMLLSSLIQYAASEGRTFPEVYDLLAKMAALNGELPEFDSLPDSDPVKTKWKIFKGLGRLKTNFVLSLMTKLNILSQDAAREVLSHDEIDLTLPGRKKCAYYIITPVISKDLQMLTALFIDRAMTELISSAQKCDDYTLEIPVYFILDEFASLGKIRSFCEKLSIVKRYGIYISMVVSDIGQLERQYPSCYRSIALSSNACLFFGVSDFATAKFIFELSGIESSGDAERKALTEDEIFRIFSEPSKVLVKERGFEPYIIKAYDPEDHALSKLAAENPEEPADHIPQREADDKRNISRTICCNHCGKEMPVKDALYFTLSREYPADPKDGRSVILKAPICTECAKLLYPIETNN